MKLSAMLFVTLDGVVTEQLLRMIDSIRLGL